MAFCVSAQEVDIVNLSTLFAHPYIQTVFSGVSSLWIFTLTWMHPRDLALISLPMLCVAWMLLSFLDSLSFLPAGGGLKKNFLNNFNFHIKQVSTPIAWLFKSSEHSIVYQMSGITGHRTFEVIIQNKVLYALWKNEVCSCVNVLALVCGFNNKVYSCFKHRFSAALQLILIFFTDSFPVFCLCWLTTTWYLLLSTIFKSQRPMKSLRVFLPIEHSLIACASVQFFSIIVLNTLRYLSWMAPRFKPRNRSRPVGIMHILDIETNYNNNTVIIRNEKLNTKF